MGRRWVVAAAAAALVGGLEVELGDGGLATFEAGDDAAAFCARYGIEPRDACVGELRRATGVALDAAAAAAVDAAALATRAPAIHVRLGDGSEAVYGGGGDAAAARDFCEYRGIAPVGPCVWDLVVAGGADRSALVSLAVDLPDGYADGAESASRVAELRRRTRSLEPFPPNGESIAIHQPHWKLAFSGADGDIVAGALVDWAALYASALWSVPSLLLRAARGYYRTALF